MPKVPQVPSPTQHPAQGCSKKQIEVFEAIASGQSVPDSKAVQALIKKGLVEADEVVHRDAFGKFTTVEFSIPVAIHIQWCEWCDLNFKENGDDQ